MFALLAELSKLERYCVDTITLRLVSMRDVTPQDDVQVSRPCAVQKSADHRCETADIETNKALILVKMAFVPALGRSAFCDGRLTVRTSSISSRPCLPLKQRRQCVERYLSVRATATSGSDEESVEQMLHSTEPSVRMRGLNRARSHYQDVNDFARVLVPIAQSDRNPQVRYVAVSQMSALDRDALTEETKKSILDAALTIMKSDNDTSCKSGAADTVAALRLTDGFDSLVEAFKTTNDWMLRVTIAASMGEFGHPGAFDFLNDILDGVEAEGDELLIAAAVGSFGDLNNKDALPVIEKYIDHPDDSIKERAEIARNMLTSS